MRIILTSTLTVAAGALLAVSVRPSNELPRSASDVESPVKNRRSIRVRPVIHPQARRSPAAVFLDNFLSAAPEVLKDVISGSGHLELLDRNIHSEQLLSDVIYKGVHDAALQDPRGMMKFLQTGVSDYYKELVAQAIVEAVVTNDAGNAVGLVESVSEGATQRLLKRKLLAALADQSPREALLEYKKLGDSSEADQLRKIFSGLSQISSSAALSELTNLPGSSERMLAIDGMFSALAGKADTEEIVHLLEKLQGPDYARAMNSAVWGAARSGRIDAIRALVSKAGEGERLPLVCGAVSAMPSERCGDAGAMAKELLGGSYRDALPYLVPKVVTFADFKMVGSEVLALPESAFKDRLRVSLAYAVQTKWQGEALGWVKDMEAEGMIDQGDFNALLQPESVDDIDWDP